MTLAAFVCGAMLTGCGGGGSKSGLKKNEFFGNLPRIHADYALQVKADKEANEKRGEKLLKSGNFNKMMTEAAKMEKEEKERDAKFKEKLEAEEAKVTGTAIPFAFSSELQASDPHYTIDAVMVENSQYCFVVIASKIKRNFVGTRSIEFGYRLIAKDGSTIKAEFVEMYGIGENEPKSFCFSAFRNLAHAEAMADFASVEFITAAEANALRGDARVK